ncbi:MAG: hypothetical protein NTW73_01590 [Candidatus Parcubacteria bacterium]|nr:hypothetical protein [Candidatus Parcubacteria bacterium]
MISSKKIEKIYIGVSLAMVVLLAACFVMFLIMLLKNINKIVSVPKPNDTGSTRFEIEKLENLKNKL